MNETFIKYFKNHSGVTKWRVLLRHVWLRRMLVKILIPTRISVQKKRIILWFSIEKKSQREFLWFWLVCTAKVTTKVCMRELTLHGFSLSFTTFKHSFPCVPISIDNYSLFLVGFFGGFLYKFYHFVIANVVV